MSKRAQVGLALALVSAVITSVAGLAAGKRVDVPVVAMVADLGASGTPLRIGSDGMGALSTTSQVSSVLQALPSGRDWMLYTYYAKRGGFAPSGRGLRLDLSEGTPEGFATPITPNTVWPVHVKVHCSGENNEMLSIPAGTSVLCGGSVRFWQTVTGKWYRLSFQPDNFPEVDPYLVTCTGQDAAGCKTWTITPSGNATSADTNRKNLARLLEIDDSGSTVLAVGGTYYLSFSITLTR